MKISAIDVTLFTYPTQRCADSAGHSHPGPENDAQMALLTLTSEDGDCGYAFTPPEVVRSHVVNAFFRKVLIGQNAFDRERLWQDLVHWQRGSAHQLTERALSAVEQALWDLIGRKLKQPVHKLLGGYREKIPAYGSTMCGDELKGGLSTPDEYAQFAEKLVARGYQAIKLHTWMPPVSFAPSPAMDIKACAAVREAVGPDIALMLDGYHWYSRSDALTIGKAPEESMASYAWLADNLSIDVLGPESLGGKHHSRADWVRAGACDILRAGANGVGGISATLKVASLAEAFGMDCEVHGNGAASLAVVGAIRNCRWYERGLLHPFLDYETPPAYLNSLIDPMDDQGFVTLSTGNGLGEDINFSWIETHTLNRW